MPDPRENASVHAVVGDEFFVDLVDRFYAGVTRDEVLRPMYPADLTGPRSRLALFLIQYWGGPTTYSDRRGHPRLRMRHMPFRVDEAARDAWLEHMLSALDETASAHDTPPEVVAAVRAYFVGSADFLRNA